MMRLFFIALLTLIPPRFASSQNVARIYVYAQRDTPARSWLKVLCDGAPVARIKRGTFFAIHVAGGRHVLSSIDGVPAFVELRTGEEAFVRLDWQRDIGQPATLVFTNVPLRVARNEIRFVVYIDSKEVLSGSVPKTDPRPPPELQLKHRDAVSELRT